MKKRLAFLLTAVCIVCLTAVVLVFSASADDVDLSFLRFDPALYYGRAELAKMSNGKEMVKAYDKIVEAAEYGEPEVLLNTKSSIHDIVVTRNELSTILCAYRYDNPQHFWMSEFRYSYYSDQTIKAVFFEYLPQFDIPLAKAEFENAVDVFLEENGVNSLLSEYQIAEKLHDAVAKQITYTAGLANSHNAYGALIEGKSVCEGYAELYQYLLYRMGMQAHIVTGDAGGPHAWNLVKIDGEYYQTDVTWDDQKNTIYYDYLNTTTARMLEQRVIDNNGYPIALCTATAANYFYRGNGTVFSNEPSLESVIQQLKTTGMARAYYAGPIQNYNLGNFSRWVSVNCSMIDFSLNIRGSYSMQCLNREYILTVTNYTPQPPAETAGDADGNGEVTADDAIYLLYSVLFGREQYPVSVVGDYDGNGEVTADDAIYLLYSVLFGADQYPLH